MNSHVNNCTLQKVILLNSNLFYRYIPRNWSGLVGVQWLSTAPASKALPGSGFGKLQKTWRKKVTRRSSVTCLPWRCHSSVEGHNARLDHDLTQRLRNKRNWDFFDQIHQQQLKLSKRSTPGCGIESSQMGKKLKNRNVGLKHLLHQLQHPLPVRRSWTLQVNKKKSWLLQLHKKQW